MAAAALRIPYKFQAFLMCSVGVKISPPLRKCRHKPQDYTYEDGNSAQTIGATSG